MSDPYGTVKTTDTKTKRKTEAMNAKSKASATLVSIGLLTGVGAVGSVEAHAYPNGSGVDTLALEVVSQTWYSLPKSTQQRYCDTRKPKRIVKVHHKGLGKQSKRKLRKAYRIFLKDCWFIVAFSSRVFEWLVIVPKGNTFPVWATDIESAKVEARCQMNRERLPKGYSIDLMGWCGDESLPPKKVSPKWSNFGLKGCLIWDDVVIIEA